MEGLRTDLGGDDRDRVEMRFGGAAPQGIGAFETFGLKLEPQAFRFLAQGSGDPRLALLGHFKPDGEREQMMNESLRDIEYPDRITCQNAGQTGSDSRLIIARHGRQDRD